MAQQRHGETPGRRWPRAASCGLLGLILAAAGCAERSPPPSGHDLLHSFDEAELRADHHALAGLVGDPLFERRGWAAPERSRAGLLAWSLGDRSRIRVPLHTSGDKQLRIVARAHESLAPELQLSLLWNGAPLGSLALGREPRELRLPIPASRQVPGDNDLELRVPRHREPAPGGADQRPLAVAVSALEIQPLAHAADGGRAGLDAGRLALPAASSASWYVRVEPGARLWLRGGAGATGEGRLALRLETDAGGIELLPASASAPERPLVLPASAAALARLEVSNPGTGLAWVEALRLEPAAAPAPAAAPLPGRPGIVIYLVDTLRADRLGVYGHPEPTSPRLDAFAREALVFEDAWAQASWTRPATASLLTGLHPSAHGADREDAALGPDVPTLPGRLRAAGYRTGAFVANHLVGGRFGFARGFDSWNDSDDALYGASAESLGRRALAWLDSGNGPFLLYLHTMEPHSPYDPPAESAAPFALPDYAGERDTRALLRLGQLGQLDGDGLRYLEARYAGEIRENDRAFGLLLDGLRERRLLDSSIVVFLSDHGEELLDHGGTEHAKTLYRELIRVPLLVRLPAAARRAARLEQPVEQIDLLPTLLGLAGVEPPAGLPGRNLSGPWQQRAPAPQPAPLLFAEERFTVTDKLAIRSGDWKLILNNDGPELWRAGTHVELYDLAQDRAEQINLTGERPIAEAWLRQELERFRRRQQAHAAQARRLDLTSEEREQLRALGYVQ